ncbi:MAG: polysaccharide deacetylase family protein [Candidatus Omnitrophica bacterium]|nr:polysaccharide deacetylase family protein [Candidatus Omnitrophota bacterium]
MPGFTKKLTLLFVISIVVVALSYQFLLKPQYAVPILMYHNIENGENESLYVGKRNFSQQMAYIKKYGYNVISLDELVAGIKNKRNFKHNTLVITFDDGYLGNYTNAYPILKSYDFPATIFLISNYIGKDKEFLKWPHIQEMLKNSKITFGGHTRNNIYLPDAKDKGILENEISGCRKDIQARLNTRVDYFCYPAGGFSKDIKKIAEQSGYKGACTTNRGFNESGIDVYALRRIKIKDSDFGKNPLSFWFKLSGYYNLFRKAKNPY